MRSLLIKNGTVITPHEVIDEGAVKVEQGIITEIGKDLDPEDFNVIDARGGVVMPGIIDIHTDAYDMEINPRPGADIPLEVAFRELERKMSGCGFTIVYHSLHLGYKVAEEQSQSKYTRAEIFEKVHNLSQGLTLLKNRIHLRFEVSGVDAFDTCLELIDKGYIGLLSVMDHTPGQGQLSKERFITTLMRNGNTEEDAKAQFEALTTRPKIDGERLVRLIQHAKKNNIHVASHDDDTVEKVTFNHALGIKICEFPINVETASYATKLGMHVIGGASNVLRGGSMSGNLDIRKAISARIVDTLCSDYYPAAILHSIWRLATDGDVTWNEAVNLATLHPARAVNIHHQTGSIETGKHADIIIVKTIDQVPMVTHTIVDGNIVSQAAVKVHHQKEETVWS